MHNPIANLDGWLEIAPISELSGVLPIVNEVRFRLGDLLEFIELPADFSGEIFDDRAKQFFSRLAELYNRDKTRGPVSVEDMFFNSEVQWRVFASLRGNGLEESYRRLCGLESKKLSDKEIFSILSADTKLLGSKTRFLEECIYDTCVYDEEESDFMARHFENTNRLRADTLHLIYILGHKKTISSKLKIETLSRLIKHVQEDQVALEIVRESLSQELTRIIDPTRSGGHEKLVNIWQMFNELTEEHQEVYQMAFPIFMELIDNTIIHEKSPVIGLGTLERFYIFLSGKDSALRERLGQRIEGHFRDIVSELHQPKRSRNRVFVALHIHRTILEANFPDSNIRIALEKMIQEYIDGENNIRFHVELIDKCSYNAPLQLFVKNYIVGPPESEDQ